MDWREKNELARRLAHRIVKLEKEEKRREKFLRGRAWTPPIEFVGLDRIVPEEVAVVTDAGMGAMGYPGLFEAYSIHEGRVLLFRGNWGRGLDPEKVWPHIPEGARRLERSDEWVIFGGGMGNTFRIRREYYLELSDRCLMSPQSYYRDCVRVAADLLIDVALGACRIKEEPTEEIARALAEFALRDYIGPGKEDTGVTATLMCFNGQTKQRRWLVNNGTLTPGYVSAEEGRAAEEFQVRFGNAHAMIWRQSRPETMCYDVCVQAPRAGDGQGRPRITFTNERPYELPDREAWLDEMSYLKRFVL